MVGFLGIIRDPPCLLTEYCMRGSLSDVLCRAWSDPFIASCLTWTRRLCLALDSALGMLYLHSKSIIHRDLKSANIMVDEGWRAKVADFNLRRVWVWVWGVSYFGHVCVGAGRRMGVGVGGEGGGWEHVRGHGCW